MNRSDRRIVMTHYVLGQLSDEERARLEEEYFANSDLFEEIVAAENDLIDAYVAGKLSGNDLLQFEIHFLNTPEHEERVAFAKSMLSTKPRQELSSPMAVQASPSLISIRRAAMASIFLLFLASVLWLAFRNIRLRHELAQMQTSHTQLEKEREALQQDNTKLQAELAQGQTFPTQGPLAWAKSGETTVVLRLSANLARGPGKPNTLSLSPRIHGVVLILETGIDLYGSYEISLETPDGTPLLRKKGLNSWTTTQGRLVAVQLPSVALQRADYVVRLMGVNPNRQPQEVAAYSFRVVVR